MFQKKSRFLLTLLAGPLLIVGCGGDEEPTPVAPPAPPDPPAPPAAPAAPTNVQAHP